MSRPPIKAMTCEELKQKYKNKDISNPYVWKEYISDLYNLPYSEFYKLPIITGCEKGKCINCTLECDYK